MQGRYSAINDGQELNFNNILSKLDEVKPAFPLVCANVPYSLLDYVENGSTPGIESFVFRLYFLCTTNYTGDNQIKSRDFLTNDSLHNERFDAADMKAVCLSFMRTLEQLERKTRKFFLKDQQPYRIERVIKAANVNVSGVYITFVLQNSLECDEFTDIDITAGLQSFLDDIPTHAPHFH